MRRTLKPTEHQVQSNYFDLVRMFYPNCKYIYAVPNGVNMKSPATRMKYWREGRVPGVPDVNVDMPCGGYSGLRIEFKRDEKQKPSADQIEAHDQLRNNGYYVTVMHDHSEAWELTRKYMRGEINRFPLPPQQPTAFERFCDELEE